MYWTTYFLSIHKTLSMASVRFVQVLVCMKKENTDIIFESVKLIIYTYIYIIISSVI